MPLGWARAAQTGEFVPLLAWMDLAGTVVTFDAMHTVKVQAIWLVEAKGADYVAIVKANRKHLHRQLKSLPWGEVGRGAFTAGTGHGRIESRSIKACGIDAAAGGLPFPGAATAIKLHRRRRVKGRMQSRELVRAHWAIENRQCAVRRFIVYPVKPGGTRKEVLGPDDLPIAER